MRGARFRSLVQVLVVLTALTAVVPSAAAAAAQPSAGHARITAASYRVKPVYAHVDRPLDGPSAANWPTFHNDPQLTGVSSDTTVSDTNASQLGLNWMTNTMSPMLSSPMTAYNTTLGESVAYIGNDNGDVEAIDVDNGSVVWEDDFDAPIYGSPTVYDGSVWVGTFVAGDMYKLDAATGAVQCNVSLGTGSDLASPTIATPPGGQPTVYFGVEDDGVTSSPVMAVDEATCNVDWANVPYDTPASGSWNPTSFGVDANGEPLVFVGTGDPDSTAYAVDANTGAKVWSDQNRSPSYADVGAGMTVSPPGNNGFADGMVYYPGKDRLLYAINMTTGKVVWTYNYGAATKAEYRGGRSAASLVGNELVFGTSFGVMAVNAITGTEIWNSQNTVGDDTEVLSSPLITGPAGHQVVVYGDLDGRVMVLSLATGQELYSFQTHGYIVGSPAESDGTIVITSSDGFVYDLGLGGTNNTSYPTTSVTSPVDHSTIPYPGAATSPSSTLTVSGTASSANDCNGVQVSVQENGPAGQWWNAASSAWQSVQTWNQATLGGGSCAGGWSLPVPVEKQGAVLTVTAEATDADGEVDPVGADSTATVSPSPKAPHIKLGTPVVAPGYSTNISGGGFSPGEQIQISLPGAVLTTVTASSKGALPSVRTQVPRSFPAGLSGITATGETSGSAVTVPLYVAMSWSEYGNNPARTGYQPNDLAMSHEETPGKAYRLQAGVMYNTGAPIESSPAVSNLVAYVGNNAGDVDAVSTTIGALLWQATTGGPVTSSPAIDPKTQLVVVGSGDDNVYAFNMATGATVWETPTGGAVESSPAIVSGVVYVGSDDGNLYALSETTGAVLWSASLSGKVTASPAVDSANGDVVVSDSAGDVTAFATGGSSPGSQLWTYKTGGAAGTPLISGGVVYVGSADGNEYALSESTGAVQWTAPLGGIPSAATMVNGVLYVGTSTSQLYALSAADGSVNWQDTTKGPVTGVTMTGGVLFLETSNGYAAGYRVSSENVWLAPQVSAGLSGSPSVVDNAVVVGGDDGNLYVYTPFGQVMV